MKRLALAALALCAFFAVTGCPKSPSKPGSSTVPSESALFEDVAQKAGVNFTADTGIGGKRLYFIESTPAGGGFLDYDNDGNLDIFLVQSGASSVDQLQGERAHCALFHNKGDGTFSEATAGSGFDRDLGYAHGVAVADYDNDGFDDVFLTSYPRNFLFRNEGGSGKFTDVSEKMGLAKTHSTGFATSATFGDYDLDGKLDLYVCYYAPWSPRRRQALQEREGRARLLHPPRSTKPIRASSFTTTARASPTSQRRLESPGRRGGASPWRSSTTMKTASPISSSPTI